MKSKDAIKILERDGWVYVRTVGSHEVYRKEGEPHITTVPHPKPEVSMRVMKDIYRTSGWKLWLKPPKKEKRP